MISNLRQLPMHPSGDPASRDEQLVNEKIFGECNHRSWTTFVDKLDRHMLVCGECGGEFEYGDGYHSSPLSESDFLLTAVRKYAHESVLANLVASKVEAAGWSTRVIESCGAYVCAFERDNLRFQSNRCTTREQAVCEAAARLGASGRLVKR